MGCPECLDKKTKSELINELHRESASFFDIKNSCDALNALKTTAA